MAPHVMKASESSTNKKVPMQLVKKTLKSVARETLKITRNMVIAGFIGFVAGAAFELACPTIDYCGTPYPVNLEMAQKLAPAMACFVGAATLLKDSYLWLDWALQDEELRT